MSWLKNQSSARMDQSLSFKKKIFLKKKQTQTPLNEKSHCHDAPQKAKRRTGPTIENRSSFFHAFNHLPTRTGYYDIGFVTK